MEFRKNTILAALAGARALLFSGAVAILSAGACLSGCSAAPIKMECQELQARIDYGNLSGDQLRFAQQELDDCRGRVQAAEAKDSAFIEGANQRFTPADSDGTGGTQ
jgi:hypothetical protein